MISTILSKLFLSPLNFMKLCMFNILMYEYVHTKFQLWYRPFLYTSLNLVKNESKSKNWKYDYGLFFIALPCLIVLILTYQMSQHIIKALQPRGCSFAERYMHLFDHFCRFFTQWKKMMWFLKAPKASQSVADGFHKTNMV